MKYTVVITNDKKVNIKNITTVATIDDKGNDVTYASILQSANQSIPTTWEEHDTGNWNQGGFSGIMTTIQAFTNATIMGLTLEEYTKNLIDFHTKAALTASLTIEFTIL